jgi:hypothetical protein
LLRFQRACPGARRGGRDGALGNPERNGRLNGKRIEKKKKWIEMGDFPAKFDSQAFGNQQDLVIFLSFWDQKWTSKLIDQALG